MKIKEKLEKEIEKAKKKISENAKAKYYDSWLHSNMIRVIEKNRMGLEAIQEYEKEILDEIKELKKFSDKKANDAQIFLIENRLNDMVLNGNSKNKYVYTSDVMLLFLIKKLESLEKEIRSEK